MADIDSIDPREMDPATFARLIKNASPEQLDAVLDDPQRRSALLDGVFSRMAGRVPPGERAWPGLRDPLAYHRWPERRRRVRNLDHRHSGWFFDATVLDQQGTIPRSARHSDDVR